MTRPLIIASISGGKDSATMSLWLTESGIDHERVFCDTGWESAQTYDYIRGPLTRALGPISEIRPRLGMVDLIRKKGTFPSRLRRFCTEELKVKPIFAHIFERMSETGRSAVNAVGVRASESRSRATLPERDGYSDRRGEFEIWRPIIGWSDEDVIDIHRRHGLTPNPLYLLGASRVGCWPCIFSRKEELRLIADVDPERIDLIEILEAQVTEAARRRASVDADAGGLRRAFFPGVGPRSHGGGAGVTPIRDAVEWSRTSRGGVQMEIDTRDPDEGCIRWGMCERGRP